MEKVLGQALKKEREMRGVSLDDIATETRIGTRYLLALENEDFSAFPGFFYVRYYIKNYLRACGADETAFFNTHYDYLQTILATMGEPPPDQYLSKLEYVKFKKRKTILIILLLLLLLAAAFLYWNFTRTRPGAAPSGPFAFPAFSAAPIAYEKEFCPDRAAVALQVTFSDSCWLQLWRGGEKIVEKVFVKGDVLAGHGYQLVLVMGNPAAARLTVNGREWPLSPLSGNGMKLLLSPDQLPETM
jgi:transcriptional regulator with XRE-family HTH domain